MKKCPGCGEGYIGFGAVCDICKRKGVTGPDVAKAALRKAGFMTGEDHAFRSESVPDVVDVSHRTDDPKIVSGPPRRYLAPNEIVCPHCGESFVREVMTNAERQRRWRERRKEQ